MNDSSYVQQGISGESETIGRHLAEQPGPSGGNENSGSGCKTSLIDIHIRTHLKTVLIDMFGDGDCDSEQVKAMFEKYGLRDL